MSDDLKSMISNSFSKYKKEIGAQKKADAEAALQKEARRKQAENENEERYLNSLENDLRSKIDNIYILPTATTFINRMLSAHTQEPISQPKSLRYTAYVKVPFFIALNRNRPVSELMHDKNFILDTFNMVTFMLVAYEEDETPDIDLETTSRQIAVLMPNIGQTIVTKISDNDFDTVAAAKDFLKKKYKL